MAKWRGLLKMRRETTKGAYIMMRRYFSIISLLAILIVCTMSTQPSRFERSEPVTTIEDHYTGQINWPSDADPLLELHAKP